VLPVPGCVAGWLMSPVVFDLVIEDLGFGSVFIIFMVAAAMFLSTPSTFGQDVAAGSFGLLSVTWV